MAQLERQLHRYYLACCRAIWMLLPQEESRRGVEIGEQYLLGQITDEELNRLNWHVEGAAFTIDYNCKPEEIAIWVEKVRQLSPSELGALLHPTRTTWDINERELLTHAAYFADFAMIYPQLTQREVPPKSYAPFLSADLLRNHIDDPFR